MHLPVELAITSTFCFGFALVTGRIGLRSIDPIAGAAIAIPTATMLLVLSAPFTIDWAAFDARAALVFGVVGVFFPGVVTLLTFRSNELLGPTVTATISSTAPLFALIAAALFLSEAITTRAAIATLGIVAGVALVSWKPHAGRTAASGRSFAWPIAGALLRGLAQALAKAGLVLWPNPFAASLIGYSVSTAIVVGVDRSRRRDRSARSAGVAWFVATGLLNGAAVTLMYAALAQAPVAIVAPIVATYPLVTALASAVVLRDEPFRARLIGGALVTVLAVVFLVAP